MLAKAVPDSNVRRTAQNPAKSRNGDRCPEERIGNVLTHVSVKAGQAHAGEKGEPILLPGLGRLRLRQSLTHGAS